MTESKYMFGKHFESLYEGSMIGSGAVVFAVWGYVIAKMKPDLVVGAQVRLNPKLLGVILGEEERRVKEAIEYLCGPDPKSTTKTAGGRRLIQLGEYDYQVVNGAKYRAIRNEEQRRLQNRIAQAKHRKKAARNEETAVASAGQSDGKQNGSEVMGRSDAQEEPQTDRTTEAIEGQVG